MSRVFCSVRGFSIFFPFSQAASVATLPSALLGERFSLGASWVFSILSRCCNLVSDLRFLLIEGSWARTWSQSPKLGGRARLSGYKNFYAAVRITFWLLRSGS